MFRTTFYGQTISDYGRKYGRVDYRALASSFDAVLCNSILGYRDSWDEWEQISGFVDNSEAIEEKKAELEELEETIEEKTERKAELEANLEDIERANENIDELLSHFDDFEYEANELDERVRWYDFELPSGEDLDTDAIRRAIDCLDLSEMRYNIENHQEVVEDAKDEATAELEELEAELEELNKQKEELEAEIEELEEEDSTETEYFQYYIISDGGYQILSMNTNEAVWYNEELDLYVWGVTHWGTSWDYVLTDIPCETYEETEARERAEAEAEAEAEAMTDEERAEKSAEELEELLNLWDTDEEEAYTIACIEEDERHSGCGFTKSVIETLDKIAEENRAKGETLDSETLDTIENMGGFIECVELSPLDWKVATKGDIVIGNAEANIYGCTTEGWKGEIVSLDDFDGDTPIHFTAKTIEGGRFTHEGEVFSNLNPEAFELYEGERETEIIEVDGVLTLERINEINKAIDDCVASAIENDSLDYAHEIERMLRHNFEVGDLVFPNRANSIDVSTIVSIWGDEIVTNSEERGNRFDFNGISSCGEEVSTPCTEAELEELRGLNAWG